MCFQTLRVGLHIDTIVANDGEGEFLVEPHLVHASTGVYLTSIDPATILLSVREPAHGDK